MNSYQFTGEIVGRVRTNVVDADTPEEALASAERFLDLVMRCAVEVFTEAGIGIELTTEPDMWLAVT